MGAREWWDNLTDAQRLAVCKELGMSKWTVDVTYGQLSCYKQGMVSRYYRQKEPQTEFMIRGIGGSA